MSIADKIIKRLSALEAAKQNFDNLY